MPICKKPDGTTTEFPYTKQGEKDAQACAEKTGGTVSKVERKPQSGTTAIGQPFGPGGLGDSRPGSRFDAVDPVYLAGMTTDAFPEGMTLYPGGELLDKSLQRMIFRGIDEDLPTPPPSPGSISRTTITVMPTTSPEQATRETSRPSAAEDQLGEPRWTQIAGTETEKSSRIRRRQRKPS